MTNASDVAALRGALDLYVADRRALVTWLTELQHMNATEIAHRSYWHPNGFAKLTLQLGPTHKIRLHVWLPGDDRPGENKPHSHMWNFASTVICGDGLVHTHYTETDDGEPYERYEYTGGNAVDALTRVGDAYLTKSGDYVVGHGERHVVDTSIIHTLRPIGTSLLATLVVQGPRLFALNSVYNVPGRDVAETGGRVSTSDVRSLLDLVGSSVNRAVA